MIKQPPPRCVRCATCCGKGGPGFHTEDKPLVADGTIPLRSLFTIRRGEPAFDNVRRRVFPSPTDIIKVKSKTGARACIFLDESVSTCTIYENRPLECRALKCWDTRELEAVYSVDRLTRKDLLLQTKDEWRLVSDHQNRCAYDSFHRMLADREEKTGECYRALRETIRYDSHIRVLLAEKGGMDPELMDFLLGRPMVQVLRQYERSLRVDLL